MNKLHRRGMHMVAVSAALLLLGTTLQGALASGAEFYVAPYGKDTSSGSKRRPFATLTKARDAVRELKAKKGLPEGGVTIHLRAGEYNLPETFTLTPQDSGTAEAPITYAAYKDENGERSTKLSDKCDISHRNDDLYAAIATARHVRRNGELKASAAMVICVEIA